MVKSPFNSINHTRQLMSSPCQTKPKQVPFLEAYYEAKWQRKSSSVLILLMFVVCGISPGCSLEFSSFI